MKRVMFLLVLCMLALSVSAFDETSLVQRYVNDLSGTLSEDEIITMEQFLDGLEQNSTLEFAVVMIDTLEGGDVFEASFRAAEYLGVGKSDVDNGLVIFVAVTDKEYFIQVGQGLEGSIPDIIAGRVGSEVLVPAFQSGKFGQGIYDALQVFAGYALQDESVISEFESSAGSSDFSWADIIFILIVIAIIIISSRGRGRGGFLFIPGPGGFNRGGGRSSGFGGFGGGGFGGGGAGGRW